MLLFGGARTTTQVSRGIGGVSDEQRIICVSTKHNNMRVNEFSSYLVIYLPRCTRGGRLLIIVSSKYVNCWVYLFCKSLERCSFFHWMRSSAAMTIAIKQERLSCIYHDLPSIK